MGKLRHKEELCYPVKLWQNPDLDLALTGATVSLKKTLKRPFLISCSLRNFFLNPHQRVLKHRYKIKNMLTVLSVSELHPEELRTVHHSFSRQQTNDNVTRREMRGSGGWGVKAAVSRWKRMT